VLHALREPNFANDCGQGEGRGQTGDAEEGPLDQQPLGEPSMTTLTTAPVAPLLNDLFAQAAAATSPAMTELSRDERERLLRSKTEYLDYYDA
jgi:hypothetical protein